jgi:hypothetical protein
MKEIKKLKKIKQKNKLPDGVIELSRVRFHESVRFINESTGFTDETCLILLVGDSVHLLNRDDPTKSTSAPLFSVRDYKAKDVFYQSFINTITESG